MQRIDLGQFLLIAELNTGIQAEQLARQPHLIIQAQMALAAPWAGFGDFEAFPTLAEKAAVYCSRIVRYHPLPDGNKRTGYDVMREFIDLNNATFTHPTGGLDDTAREIEDLAAGLISERQFTCWVIERLN